MAHIHYKFSSKLSYDTVVFDGPHITLTDLKRQIMGREKLRAGDCDLQITNAQNKEEYLEEDGLIPKGSSVIVRRVPFSGNKSNSSSKSHSSERSHSHSHNAFGASRAMDDRSSIKALTFFSKIQMANLADVDVPEEDKIKVMMNQSSYNSMSLNTKVGSVLPENYTCFRCGNTGHHIRNCPTSGDKSFEAPQRLKKSTGIPRSFMVEVDDPNIKGVMLTNTGRYAIPAIDAEAYAIGKKERPPFIPQEEPKPETEEEPIPNELMCLICHNLLDDAVVIHCCGNSYCDDCIRTALLESEDHICPTCGQSSVSPDSLIANKFLRQAVNNFKKEQGTGRGSRKSQSIPNSQHSTPSQSPAPTPPAVKSCSRKSLHSPCTQQDSRPSQPKVLKTPSSARARNKATDPVHADNTPRSPPPAPEPIQVLKAEKEAEEKKHGEVSADSLGEDLIDIPSFLISEVNQIEEEEQVPTLRFSSSGSTELTQKSSRLSSSQDSTCSSSGVFSGGRTESSSQPLQSSSSSSSSSFSFLSPVCPNPLSSPSVPAQQPPGYQTTKSPPPKDASNSDHALSTSSASAVNPRELYGSQRRDRSRRSPSHSKSKSPYSRSSRSCSSPSRRDSHPRSTPTTYSYGYKRPPSSTSSSSSPRGGCQPRSSSDHQRSRHHSRHYRKGSTSRGHNSTGGSGRSSRSHHSSSTNSILEPDAQRYLLWKKEYQEWYEKYYNHFYQLPLPLPPPPPPPPLQDLPRCRHDAGKADDHSPLSPRCRDSRSLSSQSSRSDRRSSTSRSSSDSCLSEKARESRSPSARSSSKDGRTLSQGGDNMEERQGTEKAKGVEGGERGQEQKADKKNQRGTKHLRRQRGSTTARPDCEGSPSEESNTLGNVSKESTSIQPKISVSDSQIPDQPPERPDEPCQESEKHSQIEKASKRDSSCRKDKASEHRGDKERTKSSKQSKHQVKVEADKEKHPPGNKSPNRERTRGRKGEEPERRSRSSRPAVKPQSDSGQKRKTTEVPTSRKSESPLPMERKKVKVEHKERNTQPAAEKEVWEGKMTVVPQKRISININLENKKEETDDREKSFVFDGKGSAEQAEAGDWNDDKGKAKELICQKREQIEPKAIDEQVKMVEKLISEVESRGGSNRAPEKLQQQDTQTDDLDLWQFALTTGEDDAMVGLEAEEDERQKNFNPTSQKDGTEHDRRTEARSRDDPAKPTVKSHSTSADTELEWCGGERSPRKKLREEESVGDEGAQNEKLPDPEWEKNEERDKGQIKADPKTHPSQVQSDSEALRPREQGWQRPEQEESARVTERGREKKKEGSCDTSSVAPSSGTDRSHRSPCSIRDERKRDRSRRRESVPQEESKRAKPGVREEERRGERDINKSNIKAISSSQACLTMSHEAARRDHMSRSRREIRTHRDDSRVQLFGYHPDPATSHRDEDRPERSHHAIPSLFHDLDRDLGPFESPGPPRRSVPSWAIVPSRSRNESWREKREQRSDRGSRETREGRGDREQTEPAARGRESRRADEETHRPSRSNSDGRSSTGHSRDRRETERQRRHRDESREATLS